MVPGSIEEVVPIDSLKVRMAVVVGSEVTMALSSGIIFH